MKTYYRITAKEENETKTYTTSRVSAEQIADIFAKNGYTPIITPMTKMDIPMEDIEIINDLEGK